MNQDSIEIYLPKFLSEESYKKLLEGLENFPNNIDNRIYSDNLRDTNLLYQGDGLREMMVVNLPSTEHKKVNCIVLSNTCDIDPSNKRYHPVQISYSPIFKLNNYKEKLLLDNVDSSQGIEDHINAIKRQAVSQILFLPGIESVMEDSIVFLDRTLNYPRGLISDDEIQKNRLFVLSDYGAYGAYLFILKLSIHFTRIQDNVDRGGLE